ncbi:amidohydrolase-like protein 3 [Xylariales sp. PMI_506]|nr:amidohydrolase-like protein 3 [Xylariales sp. PMI_506]
MEVISSTAYSNSVAYFNGHVFTVNEKQPWLSAFIVNDLGVFEAVGSDDEIKSIAKKRKLVSFDLRQKFVMPGLHDGHTHMYATGLQHTSETALQLELNDAKISQKISDSLCMCSYIGAREDWVIGNSYLAIHFPENDVDRRYLDELWPDRPVLIREMSAHKLLLNSEGLRRLGVDESIADPPGGYWVRREDGTLTGEAVEAAMELVWCGLPIPPLAHAKRALQYAISLNHRYGITSGQEASANTIYLHAVRELEIENRLDFDVYTHVVSAPALLGEESEERLAALINIAEGFRSKHVHPQFIKFMLDGAPLPPRLTHAALDGEGNVCRENLLVDEEKLFTRLQAFDARGLTCKVHATGQGSVRMALNAIEKVRKLNGAGPRHEIAHCNYIHEDDYPRFAAMRVTAEMSPAMFHLDIVKEVKELDWDFNSLVSAGALVTVGSDSVVTFNPHLLLALDGRLEDIGSAKKEGQTHDDGLTPRQRGARTALRMLTMGGAETVGAQHRVGSIEVGKRANFVAFDRDLSEGHFKDAQVLQTWFEGRIVYSARSDGLPAL